MMLQDNPIPIKRRLKACLIDYLVIVAYLVVLLGVTMAVYLLLFGSVPKMGELQAQLIACFSSVIPITLVFSYFDYVKGGTPGKQKAHLYVVFEHKRFAASLTRNCFKFLPWQLGHMSTIRGVYTDFDLPSILMSAASLTLGLLLLFMALFRRDKRHWGDLIAHTQVQLKQ